MWKKEDTLIRDLLLNSFGAFFLSKGEPGFQG